MQNCVSEMTNLLTETFETLWSRQDNQVVSDHDKCPVCLDALPRSHKHMAEGQMLFDVLVEDFDSKPLAVESHHLGFAHRKTVGDQKPGFFGPAFGDKEKRGSNLGQMDDSLGYLELSLSGKTDGLVRPRSLGQVTDDGFDAVYFQNPIAFDCSHEYPACFYNWIENRSTSIPAVHQNGNGSMKRLTKVLKNIPRQLDFALKHAFGTRGLGPVSLDCPRKPLNPNLQNTGNGALASHQAIGRMMNAQPFDSLAISRTGGVVDHHQNFLGAVGSLNEKLLIGGLKTLLFLHRAVQKALQVVGERLGNLTGNFPGRVEFDQPNQANQINQEMDSLRLGENSQETGKISRNFFGCFLAHGFHAALLALACLGDFGWKPFVLKR